MEPMAFLSYAHLDDAGALKESSMFHDRLQSELRIQTGQPVHIFFDKKSIGWGKRWEGFINQSLENVSFLIPILTPAFFRSESCRNEYIKFSETEKKIGRRDLVLPIYYVRCQEMGFLSGTDRVVDDILSRQYRDWRNLRHKPLDSTEVSLGFAELDSAMAETFFELDSVVAMTLQSRQEKLGKDVTTVSFREELLNRELTYENLIAYTVEMFPSLPISREYTQALLRDIDKSRYKTVRDIDREFKFAYNKVSEYARARPELFETGTDFLTKSLIFVDSHFRENHSVSVTTMRAAMEAGITRY
jgi:hypothetical protein